MKQIPFSMKKDKAFGYPLSELKVKEGFAPLPAEVTIDGVSESYETSAEQIAANALLTPAEQLKARNAKQKAAAKAKAEKAKWIELGIIEPTMENDEQLQLQAVFDGIMAGKKRTVEEARKIAENATGHKWADKKKKDDDDDDDNDE